MKEISFVSKNEHKWKTFESFTKGKLRLTPDELASYYMDILDDLAYAKTFYPKSKIIPYLNQLSSKAHQRIYITKKEDKSRFFSFWTEEIPLAIRQSHKTLAISLIIFLIAIAIGSVSTFIDQDYSRIILSDRYVDQTLNNIENGDPMAIYGDTPEGVMFLMIGSNNIQVGITSYVFGLLGPIFAGFILVKNGIMVGAFQTFFVKHGLFWTSFSTIFIHGALELSAIVIIAGAGLVIGNAWWFPGTFSRIDALIEASKRSLKIVLAILPIIIIAALIESYITRHYQTLGIWGGLSIIIPSFIYIIWYFIIYPIQVEKKLKII